ncbi:hypothetical protein LOK49_LG15G01292 [Camellia lanceoleosa]|uniref:Uncharacterized protein n=1 Tax=Camellia lanceoleosa TaxID=1840588 RepID=A0ACC0F8J9_9ERIC|nr:hypothetical protein LOK49_LG15G01292 [Camellia lanceoleosa]
MIEKCSNIARLPPSSRIIYDCHYTSYFVISKNETVIEERGVSSCKIKWKACACQAPQVVGKLCITS